MKRVVYYSLMFLFAVILTLPVLFAVSLKAEKKSLILAGDEVILPDENIIVRVEKKIGETGYYLMSNRKVYKITQVLLIKPLSAQVYEQKKDRMFFIYLAFILLVFCAYLWRGKCFISYISS